jgi:hypothetical protein
MGTSAKTEVVPISPTIHAFKSHQPHDPPETLSPESPVVTPERISIGKFLRSNQIGAIIKNTIIRAGYEWRPYVFKSFFAENMTSTERKRTIIEVDRLWWMGHKGSIETVYTKNTKHLNTGKLTELREAFKQASDLHLTPHRATYVPLEQADGPWDLNPPPMSWVQLTSVAILFAIMRNYESNLLGSIRGISWLSKSLSSETTALTWSLLAVAY